MVRDMKKHYNIPVFITHSGCRNECIFCNQKIITGQSGSLDEEKIRRTIEKFAGIISNRQLNSTTGAEIAFFGGSFTGIEKSQMIKLLEIANEYIKKYDMIKAVRISTRPDYISPEIIDILIKYNVKSVELGIQSMSAEVLAACKRGHTIKDTVKACEIIKTAGINLTGQMMLGLPESDRQKDIATAAEIVKLGANAARIYPVVVLKNTKLYDMYKNGLYEPLNLDEAVFRAKEIKKIFDLNGLEILRMGLCSSDIAESDIAAGPYHPAFGELVENEVIYEKLVEKIKNTNDKNIVIYINKKDMSKTVGHKRKNIERLNCVFKNSGINRIQIVPVKDGDKF